MKNYWNNYHKANKLLDTRITQLLKRNKITLYGSVESTLNNRYKVEDKNLDHFEKLLATISISEVDGIEETVNSSTDWITKKLYSQCILGYSGQPIYGGDIISHFEAISIEERKVLEETANMRFGI